MEKILVTGGCGYIGSHTAIDLLEKGYEVISADNFSNSQTDVPGRIGQISGHPMPNYQVNLCDWGSCQQIFHDHPDIKGIIHFAAWIYVNESVEQPLKYYENNLNSLLNMLRACREYKIPSFIFSSSCSVYGNADDLPVTEDTPFGEAESPYARTKQMGEQIIQDFARSGTETKLVILRYFNPAGAHPSAVIGEDPLEENTHLIPVLTEVASGKREKMTVFGDTYDTRDGTCVRDYIHVMDLADAHTRAVEFALRGKGQNPEVFNLGIGEGVTVLEAIKAFEKVTDQNLNYEIGPRRPGDVGAIYSHLEKAREKLGWTPQNDVEDIMRTAWHWEKRKGNR